MQTCIRALLAMGLLGAASQAVVADVVVDGQAIPGVDINTITIDPDNGNIHIITLDGYTVTKDGGTPPPNAVTIDSFTTNMSSMEIGSTAQLQWTTSNALSCATAGGTSGWRAHTPGLPGGSKNITISWANTFSFTLNCQGEGSGNSASRSVIIQVTDPSDPEPPPPPPTNCPSPSLSGNTELWVDFWQGVGFPGPTYDNMDSIIPTNGYKAIAFNTGNVADQGTLVSLETTAASGTRLMAISDCPGIFDVPQSCREIFGTNKFIEWSTTGVANTCQLDPNKTYYLNITFTDGVTPSTSNCEPSVPGASCKTKVQHINFD